jgi:hypothetical protein
LVLLAPALLIGLIGGLYWLAFGGGRRYLGALMMFIAALLLAIMTAGALAANGPGPSVLGPGILLGFCVGWLGYRVQRRAGREPSVHPILAAVAAATPTSRTIEPQDVLGQWQFYVDAAASTVTIDLQADGRYEQAIVSNSGEQIDGLGGNWRLDGPNLDLSAYRSATRDATIAVRWFFGDCEGDLVLFARDDPQTETTLLSRRGEAHKTGEPLPLSGDPAASQAGKPTRKAASRSPSLFVSHGRFGNGGRPTR